MAAKKAKKRGDKRTGKPADKATALRRKPPPASPDKVVVTNHTALAAKYGQKVAAIDKALAALIASDAERGVRPALLAGATGWATGTRQDYESHLGISALVWAKSTVLSLRHVFGAAEIHNSPTEGPDWSQDLLARRVHFVNCHGADSD